MKLNLSILLAVGLVLNACTARQVYTNIQQDHRRQCLLLPVWQQSHCLSLNDTSWEEYSRGRQEVLAGQAGS